MQYCELKKAFRHVKVSNDIYRRLLLFWFQSWYKNQFSNEVNFICFFSFSEGRSCHPELSDGGAFQVSLSQLQVDCYPYHLATGDRSSWIRYNSESSVHTGMLVCLFVKIWSVVYFLGQSNGLQET